MYIYTPVTLNHSEVQNSSQNELNINGAISLPSIAPSKHRKLKRSSASVRMLKKLKNVPSEATWSQRCERPNENYVVLRL